MALTLLLTDDNFEAELASSEVPVLVDFWAPWCGPCLVISPILTEIVHQSQGRLRLATLNVDDNPATSQQFNIMSIPSMLLFKQGNLVVGPIVGAWPKAALEQAFQGYL